MTDEKINRAMRSIPITLSPWFLRMMLLNAWIP